MKNYIVTHTFKSKEAKAKMIEVTGSMSMEDMTKAMTSDNAKCQMSWNTPGDNLTMYCWWKGTDPDAINKQLESMNDFYDCLLYTSPSPRDNSGSRMPSSA